MSDKSAGESDLSLINGLLGAAAYPHATGSVELIETHISWVLLAGDFAYKIKKPLALGFLDFRDLKSRHFYCEEEIRLNQRWAPEIYIGVVKITLVHGQPKVEGTGTAVEYAVKMRRFDQALCLDRQLEAGQLSADDMRELAANIARRHQEADVVPARQRQRVLDLTESQMWDNFTALGSTIDEAELKVLRDWTERELRKSRPCIGERFDKGFYKDCHGDLHLGNLVRLPSGITTFDCIEFSADLRHIDVACDIAFLIMDLESKGRDDLAAHFINRYLEKTDDYESLRLFDLYFVYRCLVRAKVAAIRAGERDCEGARHGDLAEAGRYWDMATRQAADRRPVLVVMHGLSGSGKTWISGNLMATLPAIRIRSDLQRKRLFGLREVQRSGSAVAAGIYVASADADVYAQMRKRAEAVLCSGHNVILDATFLHLEHRRQAMQLAADCGASFVIVQAIAPDDELRRRIGERDRAAADASEANLAVLDHQLQIIEALTEAERKFAIPMDSRDVDAASTLPKQVRRVARAWSG